MLEEITINPKNVSFLGDPKAIRQLVKLYGEENGVVYGFPGVLGLDIINSELSKKILEKPPENAVLYEKSKAPLTKELLKERMKDLYEKPKEISKWNAEPEKIVMYKKPIGTIYCTDGEKSSFGVAEGLKIVKLEEDAALEDVMIAENEIGNIHSYFIGDTLTNAHSGVFGAITHYLGNNILTDEDLFKHPDLFIVNEEKIELSKKGEYISDCLKETWDNTPGNIRSLCKMGLNRYLLELFATSSSITLEDFQKYIKEKKEKESGNEIHLDLEKKYAEIKSILRSGLERGYYHSNSYNGELLDNLELMLAESKKCDAKDIETLEKIYDTILIQSKDVGHMNWKKTAIASFNTILEKLEPASAEFDLFKRYAKDAEAVHSTEGYTSYKRSFYYKRSFRRNVYRKVMEYEPPLSKLIENLIDSVYDEDVWMIEAKKYDDWKALFKETVNDLKKKESKMKTYSLVYRGSVIKQLELIEKGGHIKIKKNYETAFDRLENKVKDVTIVPGKNFKHLNEFGVFCPMGLAEKWNTWKIERLGNKYTLAKYFSNADGELLKISADSDGNFNVYGSASPDFDESTKNEIEMFGRIINRNVSGADKIRLGWEKIGMVDTKKETSKYVERKPAEKKQKPKEFELRDSESRLLRQLRRKKY